MTLLYFAYGSNMLTERLQARVPSAEPVGRAELPGYELRFHKRSADGSGKCNVVPSPSRGWQARSRGSSASPVVGVCFRMDGGHLPSLDTAEARGSGYRRVVHDVDRYGSSETAFAYVAQDDYVEDDLPVYRWYRALVLAGALQHGLPGAYVDRIRLVSAVRDSNDRRRKQNWTLIREAGFEKMVEDES